VLRNTSTLPESAGAPVSFDDIALLASPPGAIEQTIGPPRLCGSSGKGSPTHVEISPSGAVQRQRMTGRGMTVELVAWTSGGRVEFRYRGGSHLLVAHEQGVRRDGETFVDGMPPSSLRDLTPKLTLVPAGHDYFEWHDLHRPARLLYVYLDPAELRPTLNPASNLLNPRRLFEEAALWSTIAKLRGLLQSPLPDSLRYFEALGAVLIHELVRLNSGPSRGETHARGGLATWQQRLVVSYIEEHVSEPISLATLAHLARLSPYHFSRAFKQSFGVPPHRYHTNRRIELAKALLAKRAFSVTDIGTRLGFSETSSFSAAFRKTTGLTPSRYHRSITHGPT
jgi:AraC family transcriptional regulator